MYTGTGLFRARTIVFVCRSIEAMLRVEMTFPCFSVKSASEAARAAAPSRTPSASRLMTLRTTIMETAFAPRPDVCPSANTTESPPEGRSTTSRVSPLSETAYLLTFATAICTSIIGFYYERRVALTFTPNGRRLLLYPAQIESFSPIPVRPVHLIPLPRAQMVLGIHLQSQY